MRLGQAAATLLARGGRTRRRACCAGTGRRAAGARLGRCSCSAAEWKHVSENAHAHMPSAAALPSAPLIQPALLPCMAQSGVVNPV